jgi:hypothetical protein
MADEDRKEDGGKRRLQCPCGEMLTAPDEDSLVQLAQAHLAERHPELEYSREEILFIAY